jgi:hypothetical protein
MVVDLFSRLVFDNSRAVRRDIGDPRTMEATSTDVSRHKYMVGAMCVRREQEVPSTEAQHQNVHEGEPLEVFDTTDDHTKLEGETGEGAHRYEGCHCPGETPN